MATKTIVTRIKNKADLLANWKGSTAALLDGEIAIVRVPTGDTYTNPVTGESKPVVELLMKVGDGTTTFDNLPWLSAKASDVYDWAKVQDPSTIEVTYNGSKATLSTVLKDLRAAEATLANKLADISVTSTGSGVVKSVAKNGTGGIKATLSTVGSGDIADSAVIEGKIASNAVTSTKIKDGAVTNAKLGTDISASKIIYSGSGSDAVSVATKVQDLDAAITNIKAGFSVDPASAGTGVVQGITYDSSTGKFAVSYGTVAAEDIASDAVTTAKIKDANVTTAKIADNAVTTAKIKDGNVTNAKIAAGVSPDKISVAADKTLTTKLSDMDTLIAANTAKLTGHTDSAINTLIDQKINALDGGTDSGTSGSGKYVSKVVQTDGKVATTYTSFPSASSSAAGITKLYTSVGTSTDGTVTRKVVNDINTQVQNNKADITNLKTAVAGGVHFRGTVTAEPSASTTTVSGTTIAAGDVVIYEGKEYICTAVTDGAPSWEQLGDVTRIGNLETKINDLDVNETNDAATTHKFVSQVTQTDGKIAVTYTQPTAADIKYGSNSDVSTKLASIDSDIAKKMDIHTHPYAGTSHTHGNITNTGTITATAVETATGIVVVDSGNKVQKVTNMSKFRTIIGAGTSSLTLGTTATTAAAGNHTHSGYEADIEALEAKLADVDSTVGTSITSAINNLKHTGTGTTGQFVS
jgi:hypothetical protein